MSNLLPRSIDRAIASGRAQITNPTEDFEAKCQMFVRKYCFDVPVWAGSAREAYELIPPSERIAGGSPFDVPRGYAIYFKNRRKRSDGTEGPGHVAFTIGKVTQTKCLSNDYLRTGKIDVVPRSFAAWDLDYLGASTWTPFGELQPGSRELWDWVVPPKENVDYAEDSGQATKAAWRLACRLFDIGMYVGTPRPLGVQRYPVNAVRRFQLSRGWDGSGRYGSRTHDAIWPL